MVKCLLMLHLEIITFNDARKHFDTLSDLIDLFPQFKSIEKLQAIAIEKSIIKAHFDMKLVKTTPPTTNELMLITTNELQFLMLEECTLNLKRDIMFVEKNIRRLHNRGFTQLEEEMNKLMVHFNTGLEYVKKNDYLEDEPFKKWYEDSNKEIMKLKESMRKDLL